MPRYGIVRAELWDRCQADGGARVAFLGYVTVASATRSLEGAEQLTVSVPLTEPAALSITERQCIRLWRSDTDYEEWDIGPVTLTHGASGKVDAVCRPLLYRLGETGLVTSGVASLDGMPDFSIIATGTPEALLQQYIFDNTDVMAQLPWLGLGTITPTVEVSINVQSVTVLQFARAIIDALLVKAVPSELDFVRNGTTSYDLTIVTKINDSAPTVALRMSRNVLELDQKTDPTDRATRIRPLLKDLAARETFLGLARWVVSSPNSGAKTLVLSDPAGGAGPIGFDDQFVLPSAWYLYREGTGEYALITDTVASTQTLTLSTWFAGLAAGEFVEFRLTAPSTTFSLFSYRQSLSSTIPPTIGVPISDAEVTTLVGSVITVRDAWLNGGVAPVASDGQHVGRSVRLSEFVADDQITSFDNTGGAYTYGFADVSAYQVGDWMRRAVDLGASYYGDISTLISSGFAGAMTITAIDTGANTVTVESRDGAGRVIWDRASYGPGYCDVRIYRPNATMRTVTASSGSAHTLTLNSVSGFSISGGPGAVEILIPHTSESGEVPWYLEHPVYASETPPGIGIKFGKIDRQDLIGVANLQPNPVQRAWADTTDVTGLPDGYTVSVRDDLQSQTPSVATIAVSRETDPLYTQIGGASLRFSAITGSLVLPPIKWVPAYVGQRFSVRLAMLLTGGWSVSAAATITLQLGIMAANGAVKRWWDVNRSLQTQSVAGTRPGYEKLEEGDWVGLVLKGSDITKPDTLISGRAVTASDITDLSAAQGIVVILSFANGTPTLPIQGVLDAVMVVSASEAPDAIDEYGGANQAHQATNEALVDNAKPQTSTAVKIIDLQRLNSPTLDATDTLKLGGKVLVNDTLLGLLNDPQRIVEITRNELKPGDTQVVLQNKRRRLTTARGTATATATVSNSGGTPPPAGGTTTPGTSTPPAGPSISITVTIDPDTLIPTVTATVGSSTTRVKIAGSTTNTPSDDTTRAQSSITTAPFTRTFAPVGYGETFYAAAYAYDSAGTESTKATDQVTAGALAPSVTPLDRSGWTATAYQDNGTGFEPSKAIDGDPFTTSWKSGATPLIGSWFKIDMGSAQTVGGFSMKIAPDDDTDSPLSGTVLWSDDDVTYTAIASWTYSSDPTKASWVPASHRYWKFVTTATTNGIGFWTIYDFNMYADGAPVTLALSYVVDGGDVVVTATAPGADTVQIAASLTGTPSDADVRAAPASVLRPFTATFAKPETGETLHVAAFAYTGTEESSKVTLDILGDDLAGGIGDIVGAAEGDLLIRQDSAWKTLHLPDDWATVDYVLGIAGGYPAWVGIAEATLLSGYGNDYGNDYGGT